MAITRTAMVDDDGSGTTGTIINNAWKTELYNQIDGALGSGLYTSGTWLPTLETDAGASAGQTFGFREGVWVRIGPLVYLNARIILSAKGAMTGSYAFIGNLPFPAGGVNTTGGAGLLQFASFAALGTPIVHLAAWIATGAITASLVYTAAAAAASAGLPSAAITNTTDLQFNGLYLAA
jgi:hypothetical protein